MRKMFFKFKELKILSDKFIFKCISCKKFTQNQDSLFSIQGHK